MLLLILADGDVVGLIQQNIRRHEGRIGEEAAVYVVGILRAFVLELRHAAQLAEHGVAVEYPAKLRVLVHMALKKEHVFLRVKPAGDILRKLGSGAAAQLGRVLAHGERVQVGHEIKAIKFVRKSSPVSYGAEVVAEVQVAGRLDARKQSLFDGGIVIHMSFSYLTLREILPRVFSYYTKPTSA